MKVAMYYKNSDVRIEELPKPEIKAGEFLLKVKASGICGSDVLEWYRIKKAPLVLGHEATGEIVQIGAGVSRYKVGDRVFVSHHVPCNTCRYCLSGNHTVCETLHTTNYFPGGFSEYIRVPQINAERGTLVLPKEVSYEEGTFIEPLGCVIRGQRMASLAKNQSVLILGAGISGLLHLLLARAKGCLPVAVTDINEYRLNVAKKLGATAAINAKEDIAEKFRLINENRLADLVIVCTSALSAFLQATKCVERAGTILCFASPEPGKDVPIPVSDFWRNSIKILHSYGAAPEDLKEALALLRDEKIKVKDLITHRLNLAQAGLGFKLASEARESIKIILFPEGA
ncbi:MAG: alcohol dehydrogenase catalytic domain-containing protein [Candidatus Omnitrophica bacterium]|nr:alcohol dehydrogenase catalytic domain-containing protein [Candidatus Omnitrophota bacterium]